MASNEVSGSQAPAWEPTFRQSSGLAGLINKIISFYYAMLPKQELGTRDDQCKNLLATAKKISKLPKIPARPQAPPLILIPTTGTISPGGPGG